MTDGRKRRTKIWEEEAFLLLLLGKDYDVVKILKQLKKEKGDFCLRRINSIKG